ncbi:MAG TPA: cation:proton antiporter, partial [Acidobacteriota bacterium]|nr:cation:proton antiporter [Acidobacteriota bacterium]
VMMVGTRLVKRAQPQIENLKVSEAYFIVGILLCLGLSWLGTLVGVAALIGAFLAGMALGESTEHTNLHAQASSVMEFSVPFFLVSIGLQLDLSVFKDAQVIALALVTTLVAVATKLVACGLVALPMGKRTALQVGMGMVPRGEVGIIVAQIGLKSQVLTPALYAVVVFMAVATTLVAPPFLAALFQPSPVEPDVLVEDGSSEFVEPDQSLSDLG